MVWRGAGVRVVALAAVIVTVFASLFGQLLLLFVFVFVVFVAVGVVVVLDVLVVVAVVAVVVAPAAVELLFLSTFFAFRLTLCCYNRSSNNVQQHQ